MGVQRAAACLATAVAALAVSRAYYGYYRSSSVVGRSGACRLYNRLTERQEGANENAAGDANLGGARLHGENLLGAAHESKSGNYRCPNDAERSCWANLCRTLMLS